MKVILPRTVFSLTVALSLTSWPMVDPVEGSTNARARDSVTMRLDYVAWGKGGIADQQHLPDSLAGRRFYEPTERGYEAEVARRMKEWERLVESKRTP